MGRLDGHTTGEREPGEAPDAAQVIAHHNAAFTSIVHPDRAIAVQAADLDFGHRR